MAYAFVQQSQGGDGTPVTSVVSGALTTTSGSLLIAVSARLNTALTNIEDNKGNKWVRVVPALNVSGWGAALDTWICWNCIGGAGHTITVSSASAVVAVVAFQEFSGFTGALLIHRLDSNSQIGVGTGTDAVTSTAQTVGASGVPAMVWGFTWWGEGTLAAGTDFTGRAIIWNGGARSEDRRITSTGSYAATFTASETTDAHTLLLVIREVGPGDLIQQKSDTFTGLAGTNLETYDPNYTIINGGLKLKGSNQVGPGVTSGTPEETDSVCKRTDVSPGANQYSRITATELGSGEDYTGVVIREAGTSGYNTLTHYAVGVTANSGAMDIHKQINGVLDLPGNPMWAGPSGMVVDTDSIGIIGVDAIIYAELNGDVIVASQDDDITAAGTFGFGCNPLSLSDVLRSSAWAAGYVGVGGALAQSAPTQGARWRS